MFTIHQTDREGKPHKELARSQYADIIEVVALAIARRHHPEESYYTQEALDVDAKPYVILDDGEPYMYVVLKPRQDKRWATEEAK